MLPSRPFYLIRHGQSEANAAQITAGGQYDSPLNETGRQQARALAPYLSQLEIMPGVIYHSPMKRARETAQILNAALKQEMNECEDLREHDMGDWDGQPWHLILPLLERGDPPPNGETDSVFAQRIQS